MSSKWVSRAVLVLMLASVYACGLWARLMELPLWEASNLVIDNEVMLSTNDAYYELTAADGDRALLPPSLLAMLLRFGAEITGWHLGNLGFWLPLLFAPLAALPPVFALRHYGYGAGALAAGFFIATCPGYLARTRLGMLDTDLLTLFFPMLLAACLALWAGSKGPSEPCPDRERLKNNSLHIIFALGIGLLTRLYISFYPSGLVIAFSIYAAALPAVLWLQRGRLLFSIPALGLACLMVYRPHIGAVALCAELLLLQAPAVRAYRPPKALTALLLGAAAALIGFKLHTSYDVVAVAKTFIHQYAALDPAMGEAAVADGLNMANTYAMISEVKPLLPEYFAVMVAQFMPAFVLSLIGILISIVKRPQLVTFLPIIGFGFLALFFGVRFAMYGAALGVPFGMAVSVLQTSAASPPYRWFPRLGEKLRRGAGLLSWGASITLCFLFCYNLSKIEILLKPSGIFYHAISREWKNLDKILPEGSVLWAWWDYGFAIQYYARRDTIADSHRNSFEATYLPGLAMSSDSTLQASRIMRFAAEYAVAVKKPEGVKQVVYNNSGAMSELKKMGHEQAISLLHGFRATPFKSKEGAPEQYMLTSWEGLRHLYHMSAIGQWDLRSGGSPKYKIAPLAGATSLRFDNSGRAIFGKNAPLELAGLSIFEPDGRVVEVSLNADLNIFALWIRRSGEGYLMHRNMYNSTFVRLLRLDGQGQAEPGFELVYDKGPLFRVFRSVPEN